MWPKRTVMPAIIEHNKKIILRYLFCQKINANKNGIPVCPEKNKSEPELKMLVIVG